MDREKIILNHFIGIEAAIVQDLSKAGIHVIALNKKVDRFEDLKKKLIGEPGTVHVLSCDIIGISEGLVTRRGNFRGISESFEEIFPKY